MTLRIAVIGGGISGLAAAHKLRELQPDCHVTLYEAANRVGGVLQTVQQGDYLIERSADMFTTREPWALDLAKRIGLENELINTEERYRKALIVRQGKLYSVPEGFNLMSPTKAWPIMFSPILSFAGKLRMLSEYWRSNNSNGDDESLSSFVKRRFGNEAFERLVQPLVGGIYTADPEKLSMAATMPQFLALEQKYGSVMRGMMHGGSASHEQKASGVRYGQFVAPRLGMQQLIDKLLEAARISELKLNCAVQTIEQQENQWQIKSTDGQTSQYHKLIFALPAPQAKLLQNVHAELANSIQSIPYAGCSVVVLAYSRQQVQHNLNAFGFVVPAIEKRQILAGSFTSVKFQGRAPDSKILFRVFIGGALQPDLASLPENELLTIAQRELSQLLGIQGEPEIAFVVRWLGAMPQYHVGHLTHIAKIEQLAATLPHFALAGHAYRGVGIPFCVRSGEQAAERVMGKD